MHMYVIYTYTRIASATTARTAAFGVPHALQKCYAYCLCVAVCCSVLQCVAVLCSVLHLAPYMRFRGASCTCMYVAVCCSVLQCVAVSCSVLQCVAVRCSALQCVAFGVANEVQRCYVYT